MGQVLSESSGQPERMAVLADVDSALLYLFRVTLNVSPILASNLWNAGIDSSGQIKLLRAAVDSWPLHNDIRADWNNILDLILSRSPLRLDAPIVPSEHDDQWLSDSKELAEAIRWFADCRIRSPIALSGIPPRAVPQLVMRLRELKVGLDA